MSNPLNSSQQQSATLSAILLALLSLTSIFAMLHHPSISSMEVAEQVRELNQEAPLNSFIHGVLIALTTLIGLCLTLYARFRGFHRVSILFGAIVYWLGTFAMILAALMSGFIAPQLAEHYQQATGGQFDVFSGLLTLEGLLNQALANFAVLCWCAGMGFWGFDMLHQQKIIKLFGVVSSLAALAIAVSLLANWLVLTVFGMTLVLVVISAWQLGIAWLLFSQIRRVSYEY